MILTVSSFAFCYDKNDLLTIRAVLCRKRAYMPVCMVLVELAITCIHDYMVVTVIVTKIYGKMNFNSWAPRNYSCTNNSRITISDNWLRSRAVIHYV